MPEQGPLVITRITPQKRRPGRVSVYINDEFLVGAEEIAVLRLGWREGAALSADELRHAQEELEYRAARTSAEVYLGYRPRTAREIVQKLEEKGYSPGAVENALQYMQQQGYVNDADYASRYVDGAGRSLGRRRIKSDLRRRGVDAETAETAVGAVDDESEYQSALEFAGRRAAAMKGLDPAVRERRIAAALQRRGFSFETVRAVLREVCDADNPDAAGCGDQVQQGAFPD